MSFNKLSYVFLMLILGVFASCNDASITKVDLSGDATLSTESTIKGANLTSLGTPAAILANVVGDSITITALQATDVSNTGNFITLFIPMDEGATAKVVKYANGGDTSNFATDTAYANQAITDQDFFIIEITAQDTATVLYYEIVVTVIPTPSNIATVTSTAYTVSAGGTATETIIDVLTATSKADFLAVLTKGESNQTWDDTYIHDPILTGDTLAVIAQDGRTVVTYTVTVETKVIGDSYRGGKVAYFLHDGDTGYSASVPHGLIAAAADQSTGIAWITGGSTQTTENGNTSTAIGTGLSNTNAMMAQTGYTGGAAGICHAYSNGGYSDWFLPSTDELNKLYLNRIIIGGFASTLYWTSTEGSATGTFFQDFASGSNTNTNMKSEATPHARCIRVF